MKRKAELEKVEYFGREAVVLSNGKIRAVVEDLGGMMPEFSLRLGKGGINTHWIPDFRDNSGTPWSPQQKEYWKAKILYILAGDFPCSPNFGPDCVVDGVPLPPHGWAANERWRLESAGVTADGQVAQARYSMKSPDAKMPLQYEKCDMVLADHPAYYSVMAIRNEGATPVSINLVRHNTLGAPFLETGCRIFLSADRFMSAPKGTEFDDTGRLVQGATFDSLKKAPLRAGGMADLSVVPGMIGATDFVTGAIPVSRNLGWSCVVNPALNLAYVAFFPGMSGLPEGEVAPGFNDLWLQYGGRAFSPWALHEGGADRTFCLGTENGVGAFANSLAYAREHPELLGNPTMVTIPAHGTRTLYYGAALAKLPADMAKDEIVDIEAEPGHLVLKTAKSSARVQADGTFALLRALRACPR